jgi:flagellar hook-associated protein 1 FlgK
VAKTNALHQSGFDLYGNAGQPFLTAVAGDEARTIGLNPAIAADPKLIAASATGTPGGDADGGIAIKLAESGQAAGAPDGGYRALMDQLGIESQSTGRLLDVQTQIAKTAADNRESTSGVNLDEEMTQLLSYQHAYDASARFITTVNSTLDSLLGLLQ